MSTNPPEENNDQPPFFISSHHPQEDLNRAFGSIAYGWSESDQDAVNSRTAEAYLRRSQHSNGFHMHPAGKKVILHVLPN